MAGKTAPGAVAAQKERLDKWLFAARFFRSRSVAAAVIETGYCRVNGRRVSKCGAAVGPGDVVTFPQADRVRLVRILCLAPRRGPASVAQGLYLDLDAAPSLLE